MTSFALLETWGAGQRARLQMPGGRQANEHRRPATHGLLASQRSTPPDRRWLVLATICIAQLMVVLDATIVNIALPSAQRELGFSTSDRQLVVTAYALAFGSLLLIGGRLSDMIGRRRAFIIGLLGFAAASALGGAAQVFNILIVARAVQGAFGALLAPSALALLITTFTEPRERGKALGIFTAIAGAGGAVGLVLGGVLTQYLSWRWCLYINVAFAAVAVGGALVLLSGQQPLRRIALDVPGSILSVSGLTAIVYGFSQASGGGWNDLLTIGPIALGISLLLVFVVVEHRVASPLVPMTIVTNRTRGAVYLGTFLSTFGIFGMFLLFTYYLQDTLTFSPLATGLAFLPFVGGIVVSANVVSNGLLRRVGPRVIVPGGLLLAAIAAAWLARLGPENTYSVGVAPAFVLMGIGASAVLVTAFSVGPAGVASADAGVASALVNSCNQIGGGLGAAVLNTIAVSAVTTLVAAQAGASAVGVSGAVYGTDRALGSLAIILALGAAATLLIMPSGSRES